MTAPPLDAGGAHLRVTLGWTASGSPTDAVVVTARAMGVAERRTVTANAIATNGADRGKRVGVEEIRISSIRRGSVSTDLWPSSMSSITSEG